MHLAFSLRPYGHHPAARLRTAIGPMATGFEALSLQTRQAEEAGFDFVVLDDRIDGPGNESLSEDETGFEPTTLISALATKSDQIGFIGSASTMQHAPYNLARRYASLDNSSGGRTGWNVLARSEDPDRDVEYVGLVKSLWDSWEDDAFVYDKKAARFFQPEKMHVLNHNGVNFSVRGPLNVNRSPQGRPIISAVLSAASLELAARFADVVFIRERNLSAAHTIATEFFEQLDRAGRSRGEVRTFVSIVAYLGITTEAARDLHHSLNRWTADATPAEAIVGTASDVADRISSIVDRMNFDGVEFLQPVASGKDFLLYGLASALQDRSGSPNAAKGGTLRQLLGLDRPDFPSIQRELAR